MNTPVYAKVLIVTALLSGFVYGLFLATKKNQDSVPNVPVANTEKETGDDSAKQAKSEVKNMNPVSFETLFEIIPTTGEIS